MMSCLMILDCIFARIWSLILDSSQLRSLSTVHKLQTIAWLFTKNRSDDKEKPIISLLIIVCLKNWICSSPYMQQLMHLRSYGFHENATY
jgi:hypothetical protein